MNYQEFILEVNKHRDDKLKGQLKGLEQKYQKDYDDRYMKPFQNKEVKKAQIAPMKTTVLGPDLQSLPHIDTRGPGEKLRSVMRQKNYMDDTGRTPPKIP
mgnify:CR=1 FL=1